MNFSRLLLLVSLIALIVPARAQMPLPPIYGTVQSAQRGPLGGVTVSLVHPMIGRSTPVVSGPNGGFFFVNIPPRPDPYFIEAYWGTQLLFRAQVWYQGQPVQANIWLP